MITTYISVLYHNLLYVIEAVIVVDIL